MIGFLSGKILEAPMEGRLLVGVAAGAAGDSMVGYQVYVPNSPSYLSCVEGRKVALYVHTHVREEALDLYGFLSRAEKEMFTILLGVSGIGPKAALGILAGCTIEELLEAILGGDKAALTRFPGVGKKTAERVILELSDSLRKKIEKGSLLARGTTESSQRTSAIASGQTVRSLNSGELGVMSDAKAALLGLGYKESQVSSVLSRALTSMDGEKQPRVEDLVRVALQELGGRSELFQ